MSTATATQTKPKSGITLEEFFARQGAPIQDKDARIIGPELLNLAARGHTTTEDIVKAAEPDASPLHGYFTWDNGEAAHRYRLQQASTMAGAVMVRVVNPAGQAAVVRAFHAVTVIRTGGESVFEGQNTPPETIADTGAEDDDAPAPPKPRRLREYKPVNVVFGDAEMSAQIEDMAWREAWGWYDRYVQYRSLAGKESKWDRLLPIFQGVEAAKELWDKEG